MAAVLHVHDVPELQNKLRRISKAISDGGNDLKLEYLENLKNHGLGLLEGIAMSGTMYPKFIELSPGSEYLDDFLGKENNNTEAPAGPMAHNPMRKFRNPVLRQKIESCLKLEAVSQKLRAVKSNLGITLEVPSTKDARKIKLRKMKTEIQDFEAKLAPGYKEYRWKVLAKSIFNKFNNHSITNNSAQREAFEYSSKNDPEGQIVAGFETLVHLEPTIMRLVENELLEVADYCENTFDLKRIGLSYRQFLKIRFGQKLAKAASSLKDPRVHRTLDLYKEEIAKIDIVLKAVNSSKNGDALSFKTYTDLKQNFKFLKGEDSVRLILNDLLKGVEGDGAKNFGPTIYKKIERIQREDFPQNLEAESTWKITFVEDDETDIDFLDIANRQVKTYHSQKMKFYPPYNDEVQVVASNPYLDLKWTSVTGNSSHTEKSTIAGNTPLAGNSPFATTNEQPQWGYSNMDSPFNKKRTRRKRNSHPRNFHPKEVPVTEVIDEVLCISDDSGSNKSMDSGKHPVYERDSIPDEEYPPIAHPNAEILTMNKKSKTSHTSEQTSSHYGSNAKFSQFSDLPTSETIAEPPNIGLDFINSYQKYIEYPKVFNHFLHIQQTMIPTSGALLKIHSKRFRELQINDNHFNILLPDELDQSAVRSVVDFIHGFRIQMPPDHVFGLLYTAACYFEIPEFLASIDEHWFVRDERKIELRSLAMKLHAPKFR